MLPQQPAQPAVQLRRKLLEALTATLKSADPVDVIGFPAHVNCGDSLIWLGATEVLAEIGVAPFYVASSHVFSREMLRRNARPLLFAGGGNFGDVWPSQHASHLSALENAGHRRVVQLPQTIYFRHRDSPLLERTKRAIGAHNDYLLMVRDGESFTFASDHFDCETLLVPDAAFGFTGIWRFAGTACATTELTVVARRDGESEGNLLRAASDRGVAVVDWIPLPWRARAYAAACRRLGVRLVGSRGPRHGERARVAAQRAMLQEFAEWNVRRGASLLGRPSVVVSDRLHACVAGVLLGARVIAVEDGYGKLARFFRAWPELGVAVTNDAACALDEVSTA